MVPFDSQCDPHRLRQLLDGRLPQQAQDELARHLESCESCRGKLESLAAAANWWSDAQQFLNTKPNLDITKIIEITDSASSGKAGSGQRLPLGFLSPSNDPAKIGRLGPYEIVEVIGRGGMGMVLKGFDFALNRNVAIKVLAPQWIHSDAARRRFAREAQAAAAVVHEHVIAIYTVDSANDVPYLVMPFIDGKSLQERINRNTPLELKEILRISIQIAAGLAAAHAQGLVHRDIKPANILLENGVERVLITDFGLARAVDDASFTRSCFIVGTPEYMAPEQAKGEFVDHRTDLFSLGSVMYAMCTGHSPFRADSTMAVLHRICEGTSPPIREINPDIPSWLVQIIARLHAKNPAERFQTADEVAELLRDWLAHLQQPSIHPKPPYPARVWIFPRSVHRLRWTVAAALLLLIVGLTLTEMTGTTRLLRLMFGLRESQSNTHIAKQNVSQLRAAEDTLFKKRIDDLQQRIQQLEQTIAAGDSSDISPDTLDIFRSQLARLQKELPEYRRDTQFDQLQTVRADIERLNQSPSFPEAGQGLDALLMEINARIEQLNQDLYRSFP
ncbi:MAG TPA: protein kinase [Thermoguttaceae bacterium]